MIPTSWLLQNDNIIRVICGFPKSWSIKWNLRVRTGGVHGLWVKLASQYYLVVWVRSDRMQVRRVLLLIFTGQIVVATQPETEQVSLSGVYSFLTDDLVVRRFYVQIIAEVNTQQYQALSDR